MKVMILCMDMDWPSKFVAKLIQLLVKKIPRALIINKTMVSVMGMIYAIFPASFDKVILWFLVIIKV
jgi:hypothetical protein